MQKKFQKYTFSIVHINEREERETCKNNQKYTFSIVFTYKLEREREREGERENKVCTERDRKSNWSGPTILNNTK